MTQEEAVQAAILCTADPALYREVWGPPPTRPISPLEFYARENNGQWYLAIARPGSERGPANITVITLKQLQSALRRRSQHPR